MMIYNYVASVDAEINNVGYLKEVVKSGKKYPPMKSVWYCESGVVRNLLIYWFYAIIFQWFPAQIFDILAFLKGQKCPK